jgi:uncharacterized damage-inducible protein DinB
MNWNELHADTLKRNGEMLKMTLADLSDADLLQRPVPGANSANWQLGHLIVSESFFVKVCSGAAPELPAGFADRYTKETQGVSDPSQLAKKDELLRLFDRVRGAMIEFARNIKPEQLDQPGPEPIRAFCPTVGHAILLAANHVAMHLGQIQVLRRKLGKPVLF